MHFGGMNEHAIGIIMRELVRRAIKAIQRERFAFTVTAKRGYDGEMNDMLTSADKAAQQIYVKSLRECFPSYGIIAEEDSLRVECTDPDRSIYFTVDPLDGTKAFVRNQSFGVGTMIALVCNGEVIAAAVGDVNTEEVFYFRPNSSRVHHIYHMDTTRQLVYRPKDLREARCLARVPAEKYSAPVQRVLGEHYEICSGSIGIMFSRLWKNEVGAIALMPNNQTPWDLAPIIGLSEKLGYEFWLVNKSGDGMSKLAAPRREIFRTELDMVVVHSSMREELKNILSNRR